MEAPYIVVVQGPRNSGKTTLIKSLVKHYTKQKLTDVRGPITLRANRKLRLCFYECPTEMSAMIDLAKIADLALLVVDASVGFELETFEFVSLLQNHGMPCVMGVLTHLDQFKENKALRKIKKQMKNKFTQEVYTGAKLFNLSGLKNDLFTDREIHNLSRFLSVLKWKIPSWRENSPYVLADRFEFKQETKEAVFHGYLRGASCKEDMVFIPGFGQYQLSGIQEVADPIPFVEQTDKKTHRTLKQKERQLYAPSSNVGMLKYDESTGYLNLPDRYVMFTKHEDEDTSTFTQGQTMVRQLQNSETTLNQKLSKEELVLLDDIQVGHSNTQPEEETQDLEALVSEIKNKMPKKETQEYLLDETIVTDLQTLVYGSHNQPLKKVMSKNQADSSRVNYKPRFDNVDMYIKLIKGRFMAGSDFTEDLMQEEEENPQEPLPEDPNAIKRGSYVKVEIQGMPEDIFEKIIPEFPVILCGMKPSECSLGFLKARFKRHKWNKKILKSKDPLVISIGWHRFQTVPMFCTEDMGTDRMRLVKYTPRSAFSLMVFFGPFVKVNTPVLAVQNLESEQFRVSGTGIVLELNHSFQIMKKLKLVGEPFKVFKNTAFVKGMFNSQLEVSKFEGAKIKTVSGIRGMVKKPVKEGTGPPGTFRATFEDKILMSDIVFIRTYYQIKLEKLYNPLINYARQRLLKTTYQVRQERGITAPDSKDSLYEPIVRQERNFQPLKVPKSLQQNLPFSLKEKAGPPKQKDETQAEILLSDREKKISSFLERLKTVKDFREKHEKQKQQKREEELQKKQKTEEQNKRSALSRKIKNRMVKKK